MSGSDEGSQGEVAGARIVAASAHLIHQRGVAGTTLEEVKAAAGVSGSRRYEYFPDKDDLVQSVLDDQSDSGVENRRRADFGNVVGLRACCGSVPLRGRRVAWS
jgi:TetR/AcrR family transcriptional regulator, transcriptional repressor for nem operon